MLSQESSFAAILRSTSRLKIGRNSCRGSCRGWTKLPRAYEIVTRQRLQLGLVLDAIDLIELVLR